MSKQVTFAAAILAVRTDAHAAAPRATLKSSGRPLFPSSGKAHGCGRRAFWCLPYSCICVLPCATANQLLRASQRPAVPAAASWPWTECTAVTLPPSDKLSFVIALPVSTKVRDPPVFDRTATQMRPARCDLAHGILGRFLQVKPCQAAERHRRHDPRLLARRGWTRGCCKQPLAVPRRRETLSGGTWW
ncbi:hypothetical protein BDY21DRAFT_348218 [Lineolata rhizophorae]|uniref:Uncharacterized protein n=1 Tax=Lineolata rhizophorae TaxID=578093 RepID=A0A6A6NXM0_9PEZI|nr:hypothetical protein BDY21DRAFT_348218 [Lineolata rhizophorae]